MSWEVRQADCIEAMAAMEEASIDAIVTDPPYGLGFMGKEWDSPGRAARQTSTSVELEGNPYSAGKAEYGGASYGPGFLSATRGFQAWCEQWGAEALRVLKPGGHLLAFGGTRTYHRLACALEDAGFEIRDCVAWLYGSGFPKSLNVGRALAPAGHRRRGDFALREAAAWEGHGSAFKPAYEPIAVARKPLAGTIAANVLEHGTGALNIDGCRVGFQSEADDLERKEKNRHADFGSSSGGNEVYGDYSMVERVNYDPEGRWPANVALDPEAAVLLDEQTGELAAGNHPASRRGIGFTETAGGSNAGTEGERRPTEAGGASRFFYCAKASSGERNAGLEGFAERPHRRYGEQGQGPLPQQTPRTEQIAANVHPTVKPIALMRWLSRLITPPGGTVLDPFTGSGTTGCAAVLEGFDFIGCEREADYADIARARIGFWADYEDSDSTVEEIVTADRRRRGVADEGQLDLLGDAA